MKNISRLTKWLLASVIWLVACTSSPTSNDPNEVLSEFFEHLAKKDIDGASRYVTSDSKFTLQLLKSGLGMAEKMKGALPQEDFTKELEQVVVEPARVVGDSAFISVKSAKESGFETEFKLLKQNDGWKVDFSTATLMQMGAKNAQEGIDSVLPEINKEEIEKGMQLADSMLKNVDPALLKEIENKLKNLN